jgi:hypothetical protein
LVRIESEAFYESLLEFILIPSTILLIASQVVDIVSQIGLLMGILVQSLIDGYSIRYRVYNSPLSISRQGQWVED